MSLKRGPNAEHWIYLSETSKSILFGNIHFEEYKNLNRLELLEMNKIFPVELWDGVDDYMRAKAKTSSKNSLFSGTVSYGIYDVYTEYLGNQNLKDTFWTQFLWASKITLWCGTASSLNLFNGISITLNGCLFTLIFKVAIVIPSQCTSRIIYNVVNELYCK